MSHQFLSDDWMAAAKAIREKYADQATKVTTSIRMNQVITDVPFGEGTVNLFMDTSSGDVVMEAGALETPDLTMTTDWDTARKIKVQGDMMKMMAMQTSMPNDDIAKQIATEIKDITS